MVHSSQDSGCKPDTSKSTRGVNEELGLVLNTLPLRERGGTDLGSQSTHMATS